MNNYTKTWITYKREEKVYNHKTLGIGFVFLIIIGLALFK